MNYNINQIKKSVENSIDQIMSNDDFLLEINVHERSICYKLASYLQEYFDDLNVDSEYNRRYDGDKKELTLEGKKSLVFPDIIVHSRNTDHNLLVIEIKKSNNSNTTKDDLKLREFTSIYNKPDKAHYNYTYGLQIIFNVNNVHENPTNMRWYKNGELIEEYFYAKQ